MANFLEIKIPVRKNQGWDEWAKEMRSKIKAAGIPVRWQMFHYHITADRYMHLHSPFVKKGYPEKQSTNSRNRVP